MNVAELWEHFGCDAVFDAGPRPIHTAHDWQRMRRVYRETVGAERSSLPSAVATATDDTDNNHENGFHVAVQARQSDEEKGRGVFSSADIPAGAKVWSTSYTARFDRAAEYRLFLIEIGAELACDVLQWAYVQSLDVPGEESEKPYVSVDLDEGSFINSYGDLHDGDEDDDDEDGGPNVGCPDEKTDCKHNYYALRDIKAGEELLLDYGSFAIPDGWQWFGL